MCTVSWLQHDDGYELFCNRDERLTRAAALPPRAGERDGVRYIAPVDGNFGGTWIATNEFGLSLCLLNGARRCVDPRTGGTRSRGLLLLDLVASPDVRSMADQVARVDLSVYAPFTLAAIERGGTASVVVWDGFERAPSLPARMPLISSSFDPDGVYEKRGAEFRRQLEGAGRLDADLLYAFHRSHGAAKSAYSPCMHRADARTVSFTWIHVGARTADFLYTPDSPCSGAPSEKYTLPLRG